MAERVTSADKDKRDRWFVDPNAQTERGVGNNRQDTHIPTPNLEYDKVDIVHVNIVHVNANPPSYIRSLVDDWNERIRNDYKGQFFQYQGHWNDMTFSFTLLVPVVTEVGCNENGPVGKVCGSVVITTHTTKVELTMPKPLITHDLLSAVRMLLMRVCS